MIKVNNKFDIGDLVYVAGFSDADKSRYKVDYVEASIRMKDKDMNPRIVYGLQSLDRPYDSDVRCRVFPEKELFWTHEECINREQYGTVKQVKSHFKGVLDRLFVLLYMVVLSIPFLSLQFIHWLFTGRKESKSYNYMSRITDKL